MVDFTPISHRQRRTSPPSDPPLRRPARYDVVSPPRASLPDLSSSAAESVSTKSSASSMLGSATTSSPSATSAPVQCRLPTPSFSPKSLLLRRGECLHQVIRLLDARLRHEVSLPPPRTPLEALYYCYDFSIRNIYSSWG
ncbi:Uncharacterized protein Rs2_30151 [Raphanus sativus]|nr:Uncharacterized protein Rs2_30151 [Raphanus sativus]